MPLLFPLSSPSAGDESPTRRSRQPTRAVFVVPTLLASHREVGGRVTRWTVLLLALVLPGGCLLAALELWRRRTADRRDCVSARWLREQGARDETRGIDSVNWRWPVNKITAEAGRFNAARLRKRA